MDQSSIIILLALAVLLLGINIGILLGYARIIKIWERQTMLEYNLDKQKAGIYVCNKLEEYK